MPVKQSTGTQLEELSARIVAIERRLSSRGTNGSERHGAEKFNSYCSQPEVAEMKFGPEVSDQRARLIRVMSKKWLNGTVLHYFFFDGGLMGTTGAEKDVVRRAFDMWKDLGIGLEFKEVGSRNDSEIRIGFLRGDGAWSYLGRDVLNQGKNERTMNFGWDLTSHPGEIDTALHEIGHTLGFPHEHQNPFAGIVWDEEAVYAALAAAPNFWDRDTTFRNILRKIAPDTIEGSEWDPDSIMHYPFGAGLIQAPEQYRNGLRPEDGLSGKDIEQAKHFYPTREEVYPELKPFQAALLTLGPGEQINFAVNPESTRRYRFQTFGDTDTVMVLFEERDGEFRYVKGDDDSGTDRNASFRVRLREGVRYVLRIRLYWNFSSGDTAVMMW
ncbi:MAG: M12 family metallopeptidase [Planctomycetota bacterium]|nr:M12 family metallopeptidase [Planctomycetota bacterium]